MEYSPRSNPIGLTQSRQSGKGEGSVELEEDGSLSGISEDVVVNISWVALREYVENMNKCRGKARGSER